MDFVSIKSIILTTFGAIGGFFLSMLGGWDAAIQTLILFVAVDYLTGLMVAGVFQKSKKTDNGALESNAGFKGLCKKIVTLMFVALAYRLDEMLGSEILRYAVIVGYIGNESISICENVGLMGMPYPEKLKKAIDVLTEKTEN